MGLNDAADQIGGKFISLSNKGDVLDGIYRSFEERGMQYDGNPVVSTKTGKQRTERLFTVDTDLRDPEDPADNGTRLYGAKEGAWKTIAAEIKRVKAANPGWNVFDGDHIHIEVTKSSVQGKSQAEISCEWTLNKDREPAPVEAVVAPSAPQPGKDTHYDDEMEPF